MSVNIGGLVSVAIFYALILVVGIWAGWKQKQKLKTATEGIMLAGRDIGLFVGVLTMTATWVAGGYINGTCEGAFSGGFLRCSPVPVGYALSLLIGGLLFAKPMREKGYVTMLDPFQEKYGPRIGGLLFLPALCGEIFWSASILSALGSIFTVMLDLNNTLAIIISAAVAVTYTLFGGLYSVAYTDVIQLICVLFGLIFCIPFVWNHPSIDLDQVNEADWIGSVPTSSLGSYIDIYLLIILGGIPWQVYFQRVLACRSSKQAQSLSYVAALGCLLLAVPPAMLGSLARAADWTNGTDYGKPITSPEEIKSILPMILQYLTPKWVSFIGLGAVSAAIMSSADSTVLSTSSMFVHNIYKTVWFPTASEKHIMRVMWVSIVISAVLGTVMALSVNSIFGLSYLCSDVVYVVLFPQLLLVIYAANVSNTYGSIVAFITGFVLRILSGEELLNLPAVIRFPFYDNGQQLFPFRTFIMLTSIFIQLSVSMLAKFIFVNGHLSTRWDVFGCFVDETSSADDMDVNDETHTTFLNGKSKSQLTDINSHLRAPHI